MQTVFLKNTVYDDLCDIGGKDFTLPFDISHLYGKHPYDISGGEQQLVALGKVLLTNPRLLLLDEPTKGIDGSIKLMLADVLRKIKESGTTVVIVTHDTEFAAKVSDRCALLHRGEVISCDETRRFFSENDRFTTETSVMTRGFYDRAVLVGDATELMRANGRRK